MFHLKFTRNIATSAVVRAAAAASHDAAGVKQWKLLSYLVALPAVGLCMLNAFLKNEEHARPDFVAYEHLRIRNKRFPWGEGQRSLFHNPHVNALPDGYEGDHH